MVKILGGLKYKCNVGYDEILGELNVVKHPLIFNYGTPLLFTNLHKPAQTTTNLPYLKKISNLQHKPNTNLTQTSPFDIFKTQT